jgi:hypothetical protein
VGNLVSEHSGHSFIIFTYGKDSRKNKNFASAPIRSALLMDKISSRRKRAGSWAFSDHAPRNHKSVDFVTFDHVDLPIQSRQATAWYQSVKYVPHTPHSLVVVRQYLASVLLYDQVELLLADGSLLLRRDQVESPSVGHRHLFEVVCVEAGAGKD